MTRIRRLARELVRRPERRPYGLHILVDAIPAANRESRIVLAVLDHESARGDARDEVRGGAAVFPDAVVEGAVRIVAAPQQALHLHHGAHGHGPRDTAVVGSEQQGLYAAAGDAGHRDAGAVHLGTPLQVVDRPHPVPDEVLGIEVARQKSLNALALVVVAGRVVRPALPLTDRVDVEHRVALASQALADDLVWLVRLAVRGVAGKVQDGRQRSGDVVRQIQIGRHVESRPALEPEPFDGEACAARDAGRPADKLPTFRHRSDRPVEVGPHPLLVSPGVVGGAQRGANLPIAGKPGPVTFAYAPPPVGRRGRRRAQLHVVEQEERAVSRLHGLVDPHRVLPGRQLGAHHHAPVARRPLGRGAVRLRGRGAGRGAPAGEDGGAVGVARGEHPVLLVLDPGSVIDAHAHQRVDRRPVPGLPQVEVVGAPLASERVAERPEPVRGVPPVADAYGVGSVG